MIPRYIKVSAMALLMLMTSYLFDQYTKRVEAGKNDRRTEIMGRMIQVNLFITGIGLIIIL